MFGGVCLVEHRFVILRDITECRENRKWLDGETDIRQTVTAEEVADVVSMMTGVPVQRMAQEEGIRLKAWHRN